MMSPLLLCGAAALAFYIREKIRGYTVNAVLIKSLVSFLFLAVAVCGAWHAAARGKASLLCPLVILGLLAGLLGDIWLDLKFVFPGKDRPFTLAGFFCFGVGHVLYITGLLASFFPEGQPLFLLIPALLALLAAAANLLLEKPMHLRFGSLRPTVIVYSLLLFSTVFLSGSLALAKDWRCLPLNLFFAGSVLFALSDLILSGTYFGEGKERPVDLALNYLTYYPAQFLIALSLYYLA